MRSFGLTTAVSDSRPPVVQLSGSSNWKEWSSVVRVGLARTVSSRPPALTGSSRPRTPVSFEPNSAASTPVTSLPSPERA